MGKEAERLLFEIRAACREAALGSKHAALGLMNAYAAAMLSGARKGLLGKTSEVDFVSKVKRCLLEAAEHLEDYSKLNLAKDLTDAQVEALRAAGYGVAVVNAELVSVGLVGQGSGPLKPLFEVGLSWDMVLDVPYIPGSGVKGALASVLEVMLGCSRLGGGGNECRRIYGKLLSGEELGEEERRLAEKWEALLLLFGAGPREPLGASAGNLVFLDAYPVEASKGLLAPMVLTPHYHRGGEPVDMEYEAQPVPVPHLAVAPGTVFRFIVAAPPSSRLDEAARRLTGAKGGDALRVAAALLVRVLEEGMLGARTARGYNVFKVNGIRLFSASSPRRARLRRRPHRR